MMQLTPPAARLIYKNMVRIAQAIERGETLTSHHFMIMREISEMAEKVGLNDGRLDYLEQFKYNAPRRISLTKLKLYIDAMESGDIEYVSPGGNECDGKFDIVDLDHGELLCDEPCDEPLPLVNLAFEHKSEQEDEKVTVHQDATAKMLKFIFGKEGK